MSLAPAIARSLAMAAKRLALVMLSVTFGLRWCPRSPGALFMEFDLAVLDLVFKSSF